MNVLVIAEILNGQVKRTRDASDYRDPWRMFTPPALGSDYAKVGVGTPS